MNASLHALAMAFALSLVCGTANAKSDQAHGRHHAPDVIVVAHRGCWAAAPENSIAAVERCRAIGVQGVEIDVQMSRDGRIVVFHDRTLERMTNGSGPLSERTLDELREIRLMERDGVGSDIVGGRPFLTSHRIPLLEELLVSSGDLLVNLEIKPNARWTFEDTFRRVRDVVRAAGAQERVLWKIPPPQRGGAPEEMRADEFLRTLGTDDDMKLAPLIWRSDRPFERQLEDFANADIAVFELVTDDIDYWPRMADGRIAGADLHEYMGVAVLPRWSGSLSDEAAMQDADAAWGAMIDLGFRLIMTDRPEQLVAYLNERRTRGDSLRSSH